MPRKKLQLPSTVLEKLRTARVARLATVDAHGTPQIVPVCFVFDNGCFYSAIDRKPKRIAPEKLTRLRNIRVNPRIALVIDEYQEDWRELWYILVRGTAKILPTSARKERRQVVRLLRKKYPQYASGMLPSDAPVIRITPERVISWGNFTTD